MYRKWHIILYIFLLSSITGCAWENLPEGGEETQTIVEITMKMGGSMHQDLFYYIVFNLTGDPTRLPYAVFDGEDRGKNWTVYYMWGRPPNHSLGIYRGRGGTGVGGTNLIDIFPTERTFLNELLPGTNVEGDLMKLRIDLTDIVGYAFFKDVINMNMIVCNQAIDLESKLEYEYEPYVYDSFYGRGISMNIGSTADFWDEAHNPLEDLPNEHEETAPPEADIIDWRFQVISR